jgi:hypothetical protein
VISDGEMQHDYFFGTRTEHETKMWIKSFNHIIKRNKAGGKKQASRIILF